jgi:hypothetical protein
VSCVRARGLNLPGIDLGIGAFTEHDHKCLEFALGAGVDAVSQSFVEGPADIEAVRAAAAKLGRVPFIIAKIERSDALARYDEILAVSDGIMVARGDLGVEVPIEEIAHTQKQLIAKANLAGKPVITCHADAGIDDLEPPAHARRDDRRGERDPRRHRLRDAFRRVRDGQVSRGGCDHAGRRSPPSPKRIVPKASLASKREFVACSDHGRHEPHGPWWSSTRSRPCHVISRWPPRNPATRRGAISAQQTVRVDRGA